MTILADWFETPALLLHLLLVMAVTISVWSSHRRRAARLRPWPGVRQISDQQSRRRRVRECCAIAGLVLLVIALAGPRGEGGNEIDVAIVRDRILVLDLSRSMDAEQPSRIEKAVRILRPLAVGSNRSAVGRVGLVVFAARPVLLFPLTRDLDHLAFTFDQLADGVRPKDIRDPESLVSGTRFGAALTIALDSIPLDADDRSEILLVSDGDDPIDDDEWRDGVAAARRRGVPVHVVAVGEPSVSAAIPFRDGFLRHDDQVVRSRLNLDRLTKIAEQTGGIFFGPDADERSLIARLDDVRRQSPRQASSTIDDSARPARRGPWLLAALALLLISRCRFAWPWQIPSPGWKVGTITASLLLIAAGPAAVGLDALRRGEEAFDRRDFESALAWFEKAQPLVGDPGRVAFNRAATAFRLGRFADAALAYRQALADADVPDERRRRAWYDLGNALLAQSATTDRQLLEQAVTAYRHSLELAAKSTPIIDDSLKADAEHNLALAARYWQKSQPPENPSPGSEPPDTKPGDTNPDGKPGSSNAKDVPSGKTSPDASSTPPGRGEMTNRAALGRITVLPDETALIELSRADAAATLAAHAERIARERRQDQITRDIIAPGGKDW